MKLLFELLTSELKHENILETPDMGFLGALLKLSSGAVCTPYVCVIAAQQSCDVRFLAHC
jgi:hypothetical protein